MSANKWMKWLSVIALILSGVQVGILFYNMFTIPITETVTSVAGPSFTDVATFLLSIVLVIISFKKSDSAVTAKKK